MASWQDWSLAQQIKSKIVKQSNIGDLIQRIDSLIIHTSKKSKFLVKLSFYFVKFKLIFKDM